MDNFQIILNDDEVVAEIAINLPNFYVSSSNKKYKADITKLLTDKREFIDGNSKGEMWITASPLDGEGYVTRALLDLPVSLAPLWKTSRIKITNSDGDDSREEKHLAGHHDQHSHAPKDSGASDSVGSPIEQDKPEDVVDLTAGHYIRRNKISEEEIEYTLKNGEKRVKKVIKFEYIDSITGKKITDEKELARFRKIVSPFVEGVLINPDPNGEVQVTWLDTKGRGKAGYSKAHDKAAAAEKYDRLKQFTKALPKLRRRIHADLDSTDHKDREAASVMYLIDITGFRIGSMGDTKAEVQAYGASTLLSKHAHVNGIKCTFDFIAKEGIRSHKTVSDARLARIITEHKEGKGPNDRLFDVTDGRVRTYLKKIDGEFIVKDFRTYMGTAKALQRIKLRKGPAPSEKIFKEWQNGVADYVAKHLGNGRGMALNAYINPNVWDVWRKPDWGPWVPPKLRDKKEEKSLDDE